MLKAFRRIRKKPPSGAEKLESDDVEVSLGSSLSSHSTSDDDGPRADHSPRSQVPTKSPTSDGETTALTESSTSRRNRATQALSSHSRGRSYRNLGLKRQASQSSVPSVRPPSLSPQRKPKPRTMVKVFNPHLDIEPQAKEIDAKENHSGPVRPADVAESLWKSNLGAPITHIDIGKKTPATGEKSRHSQRTARSTRSIEDTGSTRKWNTRPTGTPAVPSSDKSVRSTKSTRSRKSVGSTTSAGRRRVKLDPAESALSAISEVLDFQKTRDGVGGTLSSNRSYASRQQLRKQGSARFSKAQSTSKLGGAHIVKKKRPPPGVFQPETNTFMQFDVGDGSVKQKTVN